MLGEVSQYVLWLLEVNDEPMVEPTVKAVRANVEKYMMKMM